jgi:hypothetical protein
MSVSSIGVMSIATTTATPAQAQPAFERPQDVSGAQAAPAEPQNDNKAPPPPGMGQVVDKTV